MTYNKEYYYKCLKEQYKPPVKDLDLRYNNLDYKFIQYISNVLSTHITLMYLDISYNNIGYKGAYSLSIALLTNISIKSINICSNNIGDDGIKALADTLLTNTTLITLQIQSNHIGVEGAKALANTLKYNTTLNKVYFSENNIGVEGAQALCNVLETNTTLIKLYNEDFSNELEKIKEHYLKRNNTLYNHQFWLPNIHDTFECDLIFGLNMPNCHEIIMTSLICGSELQTQIPMRLWNQIFSFWQRKDFISLNIF